MATSESGTVCGTVSADIPTIDFGPFLSDDGIIAGDTPTPAQNAVAEQIDKACRNHGFIHLTNFGITDGFRKECFEASSNLFHQPEQHKLENLSRINPKTNMGYSPMRTESLNRNRPLELKEAFNVRFPPANINDYRGCPPAFAETAKRLQTVLKEAAIRYGYACALALGLPRTFFVDTLKQFDLCAIRFLHAPPCEDEFSGDNGANVNAPLRIGEHTDFGVYTFLLLGEHGAEGLQIKSVDGGDTGKESVENWKDVVVPPHGAIINTGALMARWTNDVWKATAHRVIIPSKQVASRERYSIAFFVDPDCNSMVKVHDKFCTDGNAPKYEPITSSDYLAMKLKEMMTGD